MWIANRYNFLICPLATICKNLWHHSISYMSYMTLHDFQENFSIFDRKWKLNIGFEIFFVIPVWFPGNHIWSLYDYQEFIQIISVLKWLLRVIYDLVWLLRILFDEQPGCIYILLLLSQKHETNKTVVRLLLWNVRHFLSSIRAGQRVHFIEVCVR